MDDGEQRESPTAEAYKLRFSPQEWWESQRSQQPLQQLNQNTRGEYCGTRPMDFGEQRPSPTVKVYKRGFSLKEWWESQRSQQPLQQLNQNTGGEYCGEQRPSPTVKVYKRGFSLKEWWESQRSQQPLQQLNQNTGGGEWNAPAIMGKEELLQHLKCEQHLVSVPIALALFGQVCTLSQGDFSIDEPRGGFQFLKWSTSFRAHLQNITHTISSAFETADVNMHTIHGIAEDFKKHLDLALEMLKHTDDDFEIPFRIRMKSIRGNSQTCLSLSEDINNAFVKITYTLMELQESCISAKSTQEMQLKEKRIWIKQNEEIKQQIKEEQKIHLERLSRLKAETLKAEEQYQDSLKLPGFWEKVAAACIQYFTGTTELSTDLSKPVAKKKVKYNKEDKQCYKKAEQLMKCIGNLQELYTEDDTLNLKDIHRCDEMIRIKRTVKRQEKFLDKTKSCVEKRLLSTCKEIIVICDYLQSLKTVMNDNDLKDKYKTEASKIDLIKDKLQDIIEEGDRRPAENRQATVVPVNRLFATICKKQMKSKALLYEAKRLQERYDEEASDSMESTEELDEILAELASLKIENIADEETIDLFNKSIKILAGIREQWGHLVQYFQSVVAFIDWSLNVCLCNIGSHSKGKSGNTKMTELKIKIINDQVVQAKCLVSVLSHIAGTYMQVSNKCLLPVTQQLQCLFGSSKSDSEIEEKINKFKTNFQDVQKQIGTIVQRNQATFLRSEEPSFPISSNGSVKDEVDDFIQQ